LKSVGLFGLPHLTDAYNLGSTSPLQLSVDWVIHLHLPPDGCLKMTRGRSLSKKARESNCLLVDFKSADRERGCTRGLRLPLRIDSEWCMAVEYGNRIIKRTLSPMPNYTAVIHRKSYGEVMKSAERKKFCSLFEF